MRKQIVLTIAILLTLSASAQKDSVVNVPPYKKFPFFPPAKLLLSDSITTFTKADLDKKKAVMVMVFNPDCGHCQHETEAILQNIDSFANVQIVMATFMPIASVRSFIEKYELNKYKNIVVTQDPQYFLPTFYMVGNLPFLAFYNKKKELISVFEGSMPIDKVLIELAK